MKKLFLCFISFFMVVLMIKEDVRAENTANKLTFKININHDNDELLKIAGEEYYSYYGSEFTVYDSANNEIGKFIIDDEGTGHVNNIDGETEMFLNDGKYEVVQTSGMRGYQTINNQTVELRTVPVPPSTVSVNTVSRLYGYDNSGNGFDGNQCEYWSIGYGTGSIICGMDGNPGPNEIVQTVAGWGTHTVSTKDWSVLPRGTARNELIYKIMYYGFKGPAQWSGFGNYKRPYPSRNGSTFYNDGLTNAQRVAYYLTHAAVSKAYAQAISTSAQKQQGFNAFWSYVNNAPAAPDNFFVFIWDNSKDPYKNGRRVQDMFISLANVIINSDKHLEIETSPVFGILDPVIFKHNSRDEVMSGVDFEVKYYNCEVNNLNDIDSEPVREWIFTTDEDGRIMWNTEHVSSGDELFLDNDGNYVLLPGNYSFEEITVPEGYIKTDPFLVEVDNSGKVTFWNHDKSERINFSEERGYEILERKKAFLQLHKQTDNEEIEKICPVTGTQFTVYTDEKCEVIANDLNDKPCILSIKDDGYSDIAVLYPGTYYIKETETPFLWSLNNEVIKAEIAEEFDGLKNVINVINYPQEFKMKTTATALENTDGNEETINAVYELNDRVMYENLKPGYTYTLKTEIIERDSGERFTDKDGNDLVLITEFIPESSEGYEDVKFFIPFRNLMGKTIVIYEELLMNEFSLVKHFDINDLSQTVSFPHPEIEVKVIKTDEEDKDKKLKDCEITVFNSDGSIATDRNGNPAIGKTDINGEVSFKLYYPVEYYYVMETMAPDGYELSIEKIKMNISENLNEAENEPVVITMKNKKKEYVDTSDDSSLIMWISIGVISAIGSVLMFSLGKRRI